MTSLGLSVAKRFLDLAIIALASPVWIPVMALVSATVGIVDGRPVLFRQARLGRGRVEFDVIKFRTMTTEVDPSVRTVTSLGRILRRIGLDELPQLLNVLRGDMSLVGPRPVLPESANRFRVHGATRFQVRPGITGLAQVEGRNTMLWSERARLDDEYVATRSFRGDAALLLRTPITLARSGRFEAEANPERWDDLNA